MDKQDEVVAPTNIDLHHIPAPVDSVDQVDTTADITASDYGQQRGSAASGDKSTTAVAQ